MLTSRANKFAIAAGCFGTDGLGAGFPADLPLSRFTAVTLKSTTLRAQPGNAGKVRYAGDGYHLNAIGLRNPGIREVLDVHLPRWQGQGCPIGISLWGETPDEYARLAQTGTAAGVDYIELNLSCVNADTPTLTPADIANIAARCQRPVYAKIGRRFAEPTPTTDETRTAAAIAGIRQLAGVIIGNTVSVPTHGLLDTPTAGLSGDQLSPLNLALLKAVKPHTTVPLIACGGINNAGHVAEYRAAGAAGWQVGTAMLTDPIATYQRITHAQGCDMDNSETPISPQQPNEADCPLPDFAKGMAGAPVPNATVVTQAKRIIQAAVRHTRQPHITVDNDDGSLGFDLRLANGWLVMANLFPDGSIDASVYDDSDGVPVRTVRRIRGPDTAGVEDFIRLLQGDASTGTQP